MPLDPSQYLPVDGSDEPELPAGATPPETATVLFTYPRVSTQVTPFTYKLTLAQVRSLLVPVSVEAAAAASPAVSFVVPAPGTAVTAGEPLVLRVQAMPGGTALISKVSFFRGTLALGDSTLASRGSSEYRLVYTPTDDLALLELSAVATDTAGATGRASTLVLVKPAIRVRPTLTITSPVTGDRVIGGSPLILIAVAADPGGIVSVEFRSGGVSLGFASLNGLEYQLFYTPDAAGGVLPITAIATNTAGVTTSVSITVIAQPASSTAPAITGFAPRAGVPGTVVTLTGINLNNPQTVTVGGVAATAFTPISATSIRVVMPDFGAPAGLFEVLTPAGTAISPGSFALASLVAKPDAPTNLLATAGDSQVSISAIPPVNNGGAVITGYHVFRNGAGAPLASNVALPFVDNTAVNGTEYYYELMAHNSAGDSVKSARSNTARPAAPVITYSYQTTFTDFTTKCGQGIDPGPQTRTSTVSLADATTQAIAAITCPVAVVYNTTITGPSASPAAGQPGVGITLTSGGADVLKFNNIVGGSTLPQRMNLSIAGTVVAAVDFPTSYLGAAFTYTPAGGTLRTGTFANGTVTL